MMFNAAFLPLPYISEVFFRFKYMLNIICFCNDHKLAISFVKATQLRSDRGRSGIYFPRLPTWAMITDLVYLDMFFICW